MGVNDMTKILYCLDCGCVLKPEEIEYPNLQHFGGQCEACKKDPNKFNKYEGE